MNTNIDITDVSNIGIDEVKKKLMSDSTNVLLFMPNLDYKGMDQAECIAEDTGLKLFCIPITLPVMDLYRQIEYAGIDVDSEMIAMLENGIRKILTEIL